MRKKKLLSVLVAVILSMSVMSVIAAAVGESEGDICEEQNCSHVAAIGAKHYTTLQAAVDAVNDGTATTITLLDNASGNGVKVPSDRNITFNLAGFTYDINGQTVGSTGTETNGFQLLRDSNITFENGRLVSSKAIILIQNYSNLTLKDVDLDGTATNKYVLSNNHGNIVITGKTNIAAASGQVAFDVYFWPPSYQDGVSVTIDKNMTGTITGSIECAVDEADAVPKNVLVIEGGTIDGTIKVQQADSVLITNAIVTGGVSKADGATASVVVQNSTVDGTISEGVVVLDSKTSDGATIQVIPQDVVALWNGKTYKTLAEAINSANTGDIVNLIADTHEDIIIPAGKAITLNLAENVTLTNASGHTITNNGTLTVTGSGTVDNVSHQKAAVLNNPDAEATLNGCAYTRSRENGINKEDAGGNSYYNIVNWGTMTINEGVSVSQSGHFSSMIENGYFNGNGKTNTPTMTINGGTFSGGLNTVKNDDFGKLIIKGGAFFNVSQAVVLNWNEAEISGGTFSVTEQAETVILNGANAALPSKMDLGKLTITGGTFAAGSSVPVITNNIGSDDSNNVSVSGGNYSAPVSEAYLDKTKVNAELKSASNTATPYSYYQSVEAAQAAAKPGDTIRNLTGNPDVGVTYTVTLKYNDGTTQDKAYIGQTAAISIVLPTPTRDGYTFRGWYDGSKYVTSPYQVTGDAVLTAQWSYNGSNGGSTSSGSSSSSTTTVSVTSSKNGTVSASPKNAKKDDTVTLTVKPNAGYELDELTVTDKNGKTVKVTEGKNGKFTFTMPATKVTVEATFVKIEETQTFIDVPDGYWAEDAIAWAAENGYMNGNSAVTFNPEGTVTRQQLWMILARLSGYQPADFTEAKAWAVDNGISDGTVPGNAVSRQQLVTILYRYAVRMGYNTAAKADLTIFPDHASVAPYAADAMAWSVANNIVGGTTQGTLNPAGTATRAQFAVILMRFYENIVG